MDNQAAPGARRCAPGNPAVCRLGEGDHGEQPRELLPAVESSWPRPTRAKKLPSPTARPPPVGAGPISCAELPAGERDQPATNRREISEAASSSLRAAVRHQPDERVVDDILMLREVNRGPIMPAPNRAMQASRRLSSFSTPRDSAPPDRCCARGPSIGLNGALREGRGQRPAGPVSTFADSPVGRSPGEADRAAPLSFISLIGSSRRGTIDQAKARTTCGGSGLTQEVYTEVDVYQCAPRIACG